MIELKLSDASLRIKEKTYVSITWVSKDCPVCENFEDVVDSTSEDLPDWSLYKIEVPHGGGLSWYEPHISPTTYVFKNGVRQIVAPGETTKEDFIDTLLKIQEGIWKTQFEVELEQLERLG